MDRRDDRLLRKQNLGDLAKTLGEPWVTYRVGRFGNLALDMFICQGTVAMHRHLDEDELFLVYEGSMLLSSERGDLMLRTEELVVVPRGTAHQSSAFFPTTVLLLRLLGAPMRRNGHGRLFAVPSGAALEKVNLGALYLGLGAPYQPIRAVTFEGWALWLMRCAGAGPTRSAPQQGMPLLVLRGVLAVLTDDGQALPAQRGDVLAIPPGTSYHLETDTASMAAWLEPLPTP
mgnify:CR=1 FL=1